jgi:probable F420-dependent oxidoreductase
LGSNAVWLGGSPGGDLQMVEDLLDATTTLIVATGIVNIWSDAPAPIAAAFHRINAAHPGRFLLGVGVGHPEATGERYRRPYAALVQYLDELDEAGVPRERLVVAALGPKVLALSGERTAGAHPLLVTPQHSREARAIVGPDALIAPAQNVVIVDDLDQARAIGRPEVHTPYLSLTNYTNNFRRLGYADADLAAPGSDRLIDDLTASGTGAALKARLAEHLDAGADHVALRVLPTPGSDLFASYESLAAAIL